MAKWKDITKDERFAKIVEQAGMVNESASDKCAGAIWEGVNEFMTKQDGEIARLLDEYPQAREEVVNEIIMGIHDATRERIHWAGYLLPKAKRYYDDPED